MPRSTVPPFLPSPVPSGVREGIDQGYDWSAGNGAYAHAIAPGVVTKISPRGSWAGGTGAAVYETLDSPVVIGNHSYNQIYYAEEDPAPNVHLGSHLALGDPVLQFSAQQSEIGFAAGNQPAAPRPPARPANQWTEAGQDFAYAVGLASAPSASAGITATGGVHGATSPGAAAQAAQSGHSLSAACQGIVDRVLARKPAQMLPTDYLAWKAAGCPGDLQSAVAYASTAGTGSAADAGSYDAGNAAHDVAAPVEGVAAALKFLFSVRFLEIVGGGLLLLIGVRALASQMGVSVPAVPVPVPV